MNDIVITDRGALADGTTLNTAAINRAITEQSAAGGGRVVRVVPAKRSGILRARRMDALRIRPGSAVCPLP
jgi:hypothetical protein